MTKQNLAIVMTLALIVLGCAKNPFSTRSTEEPYGSGGTWETPQSPEVVVSNLLFAYHEMIISNYELCFSDSFVFSSPEDSIDAVNGGRGELFADWNKDVEIATATNIFATFAGNDTLGLFLSFSPSGEYDDLIEDSTAVLYRDYDLRVIRTAGNSADTLIASGLATFHLREEELNWWTIFLWEDIPAVSGEYDWGDFKGEYRR